MQRSRGQARVPRPVAITIAVATLLSGLLLPAADVIEPPIVLGRGSSTVVLTIRHAQRRAELAMRRVDHRIAALRELRRLGPARRRSVHARRSERATSLLRQSRARASVAAKRSRLAHVDLDRRLPVRPDPRGTADHRPCPDLEGGQAAGDECRAAREARTYPRAPDASHVACFAVGAASTRPGRTTPRPGEGSPRDLLRPRSVTRSRGWSTSRGR